MTDNSNLLLLADEEGNELECEHLETITYNDTEYAVMYPTDQKEDGGEVIILEKDGDNYATIIDENILNAVFTEFMQNIDE